MFITFLFVVFAVHGAGATNHLQASQAPAMIDYDRFCSIVDLAAKQQAFIATPGENKATLARTQVERFMAANKARLTPLQDDYLLELLKYLTPESYSGSPRTADAAAQLRALESRMMQLFSREDANALQPNGPCQPKIIK